MFPSILPKFVFKQQTPSQASNSRTYKNNKRRKICCKYVTSDKIFILTHTLNLTHLFSNYGELK